MLIKAFIEQSGIVFGSDQHQLTVDNTVNNGGIIAHVETNTNGENINKTLNFTTKTIKTTDIKDHATSEQRSLGVNVGINNAKDKGTSKNEQSLGTSSINASHSGHDYQATTQATIGEGAIVTSDVNALANVNRDVNTATTITKNQDVGGLNANLTVDSRLFTEVGRAQIKGEQAEVGVNIQKTGEILGDAISTSVLKGAEVFMENKTDAAKISAKIDAKLIKMGIPTKENGGLYSEIPIVLGGDDIQQKPYLIVGTESEKFKKNQELFMPVEDMAGYNDLPQQSKDQTKGLYISKEVVQITADTATHQNFVNGMLNSKTEAMVNGLQQTFGSAQNGTKNTNVEYTLNFNQTKGYLSDGLEAGVDKVAGMDFFGYRPLSWFNSGASDAAGKNANAVINLLPSANFAQHSQGNLLINAALPEFVINKTADQMQTNGRFNFTFNGYGSPVNNVDFSNGLAKLGLQLYSSTSNTKDPVSEFLGGNYGLYHVDLQPKLNNTNESLFSPTRYFSVKNLGLFGNDKYDKLITVNESGVVESKAQEVSPHSSYSCSGKCGFEGINQPLISQIKESMDSANKANKAFVENKKLLGKKDSDNSEVEKELKK